MVNTMNINIYNPYVRRELELYHHGILGMKWGKRNGPPYPLSSGAHSASEKKSGWRKSLNGGSGIKYGSSNKKLSKPLSSTGHPLAKEKLEDELRELSKIADKSNDKITSDDIDRRIAFQGLINDLSIDPNNITRPKSDNAIKWKQDMENTYRKLHDTLDEKVTDVDHNVHLKIDKLIRDFDSKYKNSIENPTEWNKVTKKIEKLYNSPEYLNAWKEFDDAFDALKNVHKDKLIEVVLKDLDIPINSKNKAFVINSQLIDFAPLNDY